MPQLTPPLQGQQVPRAQAMLLKQPRLHSLALPAMHVTLECRQSTAPCTTLACAWEHRHASLSPMRCTSLGAWTAVHFILCSTLPGMQRIPVTLRTLLLHTCCRFFTLLLVLTVALVRGRAAAVLREVGLCVPVAQTVHHML